MTVSAVRKTSPRRAAAFLAAFAVPGLAYAQTPPPAPTAPTVNAPAGRVPRHGHAVHAAPAAGAAAATAPAVPAAAALPVLSLGECIAYALQKQPSIKAVQASLEATEAGIRGLENIGPLASLFSKDLPIRKQQASRGVVASSADLQKTHNEVVNDVTRLYYLSVLAKAQHYTAREAAEDMEQYVENAQRQLGRVGEMTQAKIDLMKVSQSTVRQLVTTAALGRERAMAALREAMGVDDCNFRFALADDPKGEKENFDDPFEDVGLPLMAKSKDFDGALVRELALARRPELALTAAAVDAFRLEVYAQGCLPFRRAVPTLASASDIHSKIVPQAVRSDQTTGEYRPGAIPPEMPVQLVGTTKDRVARAMAFSHRADEVFAKTRNLVVLEAETAYAAYSLAANRLSEAETRLLLAQKIWQQPGVPDNVKRIEVTAEARLRFLQAFADYLDARYQVLLSMSNLERVTAGGIRPAFPGR